MENWQTTATAKSILKGASIEKCLSLCVKLIREFVGKGINVNRISGFYIKSDKPIFTKFNKRDINNAS